MLAGNPLIVLVIMGFMGYKRRTGFLAGLTVAQISEFSLIVAALGLSLGHITNETVGLITLVGIVTIFMSTYMILYSDRLYHVLSEYLKIFEKKNPYREAAIDTSIKESAQVDVILMGMGNYGSALADYLLRRNKTVLCVDFDPTVLDRCCKLGLYVLYGDMADPEIHEKLPLNKARWVISTVRSNDLNLTLLNNLKNEAYQGRVAVTATNEEEAREFENAGAHLIFRPFKDATEQAADALTYAMDFLPEQINWPISFLEVRIKSDAAVVGQSIRDLPLRTIAGVSILAVSRGGQVYYDAEPDFRIFPGDRLLIMGPPGGLKEAGEALDELELRREHRDKDRFEIAEIKVATNSQLSGKTLMDISFRQKYGVNLIGIRRDKEQIIAILPAQQLLAGDHLIVIGKSDVVQNLKKQEPL